MKRLFCGAVATVLFTVCLGSTAFATTSLELIINGVDTIFIPDNGGAGSIKCTGPDCATATFPSADANAFVGGISAPGILIDGWAISVTSGGSNSPSCPAAGINGPGCLNDQDISAQTTGAGTLKAFFESDNFATENSFLVANSSVIQTGSNETQNAYIGTGAVNLADGNFAPANVGAQCGASLMAAPPGVAAQSTSCGGGTGPLTLELMTTFTTVAGGGAFNVNGNIAGTVPEPVSVALFGTVLVLCASGLRRRRRLSQKG